MVIAALRSARGNVATFRRSPDFPAIAELIPLSVETPLELEVWCVGADHPIVGFIRVKLDLFDFRAHRVDRVDIEVLLHVEQLHAAVVLSLMAPVNEDIRMLADFGKTFRAALDLVDHGGFLPAASSSSATRGARLPGRCSGGRAASNWRTVGRFSWTRWATCRLRFK